MLDLFFFFSSRRRHTRSLCDWSSDVCSSDLIRRGDRDRPLPRGIGRAGCLRKSSIAVSKQNRHRPLTAVQWNKASTVEVGYSEVKLSIVIEIPSYERLRLVSNRHRRWRPKRAIAISQQDHHGVAAGVRHCEIQFAIAVQVRRNHGQQIAPERDRGSGRERSIAVSEPPSQLRTRPW